MNSVWPLTLFLIVCALCVTVVLSTFIASRHPFTFRIEMDNNTRIAMESINYSAMRAAQAPVDCGLVLRGKTTVQYPDIADENASLGGVT